jgi:flavin-binding protein dodecin
MHEEHVYKVIELVGSSERSIEDAIQTAVSRAGRSVRNLRWFEVMQTRGHGEGGQVRHYQVTLKSASPSTTTVTQRGPGATSRPSSNRAFPLRRAAKSRPARAAWKRRLAVKLT